MYGHFMANINSVLGGNFTGEILRLYSGLSLRKGGPCTLLLRSYGHFMANDMYGHFMANINSVLGGGGGFYWGNFKVVFRAIVKGRAVLVHCCLGHMAILWLMTCMAILWLTSTLYWGGDFTGEILRLYSGLSLRKGGPCTLLLRSYGHFMANDMAF